MSRVALARKLVFLGGVLATFCMAALHARVAGVGWTGEFDAGAYLWAPVWIAIPILCCYLVAEGLDHWFPSTPMRICLLLMAVVNVATPIVHAIIAVKVPLSARDESVWHLWPLLAFGAQFIYTTVFLIGSLVGGLVAAAIRSRKRRRDVAARAT